jgi:hypothetical protein
MGADPALTNPRVDAEIVDEVGGRVSVHNGVRVCFWRPVFWGVEGGGGFGGEGRSVMKAQQWIVDEVGGRVVLGGG